MAILRRIGPASAFKIGLVSNAFLGLIAGVFCNLITLTGASFAPHGHMPFARTVGLMAVVLCPIVYGIIGGITAVIGALIYNLSSGAVGGVEVEIN